MTKRLAIGMLLAASASVASASPILTEHFSYPTGALSGNQLNSTQAWTFGSGTGDAQVIASGLTNPTDVPAATGGAAQLVHTSTGVTLLSLGQSVGTGNLFYSALIQVPSTGNVSSLGTGTGSYFAGFDDTNNAANSNHAGAVLAIHKQSSTSTGYNLGIAVTPGQGTLRVFDDSAAHTFSPGDTVFVVAEYTFDSSGVNKDFAQLWIDPTSPNDAPSAQSFASTFPTSPPSVDIAAAIQNFFLRNNGSEPSNITVDEVRVGTTWADVAPVPEPASLGLLAAAATGILIRRQRRA